MYAQNWTEVTVSSLQSVWYGVVGFIPTLIGALIVFLVLLIVAVALGKLIEKVFDALKLDSFLSKLGLAPYFERAGLRLRGSYFLGQLVYWFFFVTALLAASNILGLNVFSQFLTSVLFYIPNIAAAVLIMLASIVVGNFARKIVVSSVMGARLHAARFLGALAWWAVVVFGFLASLIQLNVATSVINTLITGFIAMLALAGGLAFGLGGKDYAAHLLGRLRESTESR